LYRWVLIMVGQDSCLFNIQFNKISRLQGFSKVICKLVSRIKYRQLSRWILSSRLMDHK
jgi:hypothetical protein